MTTILTTHGYLDDCNGYSGAYSWWRNTVDRRFHSVIDCTGFNTASAMLAVTDDYGNLIKVTP